MMPVWALCCSRPVISAARVGEQSAVVLNSIVLEAARRERFEGRRRNRAAEGARSAEADVVGQDQEDVRRALGRFHRLRKVGLRIRRRAADHAFERRRRVGQNGDVRRPGVVVLRGSALGSRNGRKDCNHGAKRRNDRHSEADYGRMTHDDPPIERHRRERLRSLGMRCLFVLRHLRQLICPVERLGPRLIKA